MAALLKNVMGLALVHFQKYWLLSGCVIYFMVKLNTPGCAANPWPEKSGPMTLTYWPFKATKFDWNVQTLMFSEWNTRSVKPLMELLAASFFGAASPATLPKQKPWSWRCTGCIGNLQPPGIQHGKVGKPAPLIDLVLLSVSQDFESFAVDTTAWVGTKTSVLSTPWPTFPYLFTAGK